MASRQTKFLRLFLVWLAVSLAIGIATFVVCGGFEPFLCDTRCAPVYTPTQRALFLVARAYAYPVTAVFAGIGRMAPFDVRASPFMLEIADLKIGPGVVVFYAGFYAGITMGVLAFAAGLRGRTSCRE